jgi:hypothetical protein
MGPPIPLGGSIASVTQRPRVTRRRAETSPRTDALVRWGRWEKGIHGRVSSRASVPLNRPLRGKLGLERNVGLRPTSAKDVPPGRDGVTHRTNLKLRCRGRWVVNNRAGRVVSNRWSEIDHLATRSDVPSPDGTSDAVAHWGAAACIGSQSTNDAVPSCAALNVAPQTPAESRPGSIPTTPPSQPGSDPGSLSFIATEPNEGQYFVKISRSSLRYGLGSAL